MQNNQDKERSTNEVETECKRIQNRITSVARISVWSECCVSSDRGLSDGPIPRLEESYLCLMWLENLSLVKPRPTRAVELCEEEEIEMRKTSVAK
jgi:hypothetical protein